MKKKLNAYSAYLCSQCELSTVSAKGETCKECRASDAAAAERRELGLDELRARTRGNGLSLGRFLL